MAMVRITIEEQDDFGQWGFADRIINDVKKKNLPFIRRRIVRILEKM